MRTPIRLFEIPRRTQLRGSLFLRKNVFRAEASCSGSRSSPPTTTPRSIGIRAIRTTFGPPLLTTWAAAICDAPSLSPTSWLLFFELLSARFASRRSRRDCFAGATGAGAACGSSTWSGAEALGRPAGRSRAAATAAAAATGSAASTGSATGSAGTAGGTYGVAAGTTGGIGSAVGGHGREDRAGLGLGGRECRLDGRQGGRDRDGRGRRRGRSAPWAARQGERRESARAPAPPPRRARVRPRPPSSAYGRIRSPSSRPTSSPALRAPGARRPRKPPASPSGRS